MKPDQKGGYAAFRRKLMRRVCGSVLLSIGIVLALYLLVWKRRMGNVVIWFLHTALGMDSNSAYYFYDDMFRGHKDLLFFAAISLVFLLMLWRVFRGMTRYFKEIDRGIEALLADDGEQIHLSSEMQPFEQKLNTVKRTLAKRKAEAALAEQRKDELVMYLAHDIRTPLTSVIGYLDLLAEEPDISAEQRARRVHIALEKAYRLEAMINEFFEITRYNSQQIALSKQTLDLYYMLVQLSDEFTPVFSPRGNRVVLRLDEELTVEADPEKLARVFSNILKNTASYSYPNTEITISAEKTEHEVIIRFQNSGENIPDEALAALFDKFYRGDQARSSDTGGTGLGLAIAREIVTLHGGTISASSSDHVVTFTVSLPYAGTGPQVAV